MMTWTFIYQLQLWICALTHLTSAMIYLHSNMSITVWENQSNLTLSVATHEVLCLQVTSQANEAEEDKDYDKVNMTLTSTGNKLHVPIYITNDILVEPDESFAVVFSVLDAESYPEDCKEALVGSGWSSSSQGSSGMLLPMAMNVTACITIKDDDIMGSLEDAKNSYATEAAVASGGVVIIVLIIALSLFAIYYFTKRKRMQKLIHNNGTDGSYIEFNSTSITSVGDKTDDVSTTTLNTSSEGRSLSPSASAIVPATYIPPLEFSAYVKELHKDADKGFNIQFNSLEENSATSLPCNVAVRQENSAKNRYHNILPYDSTRIVLSKTEKRHSDYINASWINGYRKEKTYLSCQGPMQNTIDDFWRMIWEVKIPTIVMLTKAVEATKVKCEQYWPRKVGETLTLDGGNLTVQLREIIPYADYELRKIIISDGTDKRKLSHYYFQSWPDHGVPRYATALLGFIRAVRKTHFPSYPSPLVVHCSAGVGRTGTFIVLDIMLQVLEAGGGINVYDCILKLRSQRSCMVQTEAQYIFIHDALEELITCGKTEISVTDLRIAMNRLSTTQPTTNLTGFEQQFQLLELVTRQPLKKDLEISQKTFNQDKNRYSHALPYNFQRVCLRVTGQPGSDYINASWINGYRQSNTFLVTQGPLHNTVNEFWRMIWENSSRIIIMLCDLKEKEQEVSAQYWPDDKAEYGKLTVTTKQEKVICDSLCTRVFDVCRTESIVAPVPEVVTVTQFHVSGWSTDGPPSDPSLLLDLVDRVLKKQRSTGNKPVTVMCSDGSGRSGVFVVLYTQLERLKTEHLVDVFQGVKSARTQRMRIVHSAECYKLIHQLLLEYLTSFEDNNYYNFAVSSNTS